MLKALRVMRWLLIVAWVGTFGGCVNLWFHASDRDPSQLGAGILSAALMFAAFAMSAIYLVALLVSKRFGGGK